MENYKVKVDSEAESKEVYGLFKSIDMNLSEFTGNLKHPYFIATYNGVDCSDFIDSSDNGLDNHKELTTTQLRDLVFLKRNDVNDATHIDQDNWKWFISSDGIGYVWMCGNSENLKQWDESPLDHVDLKPIKKEEVMKEFLDITKLYTYVKDTAKRSEDCIEIPEGADFCLMFDSIELCFYKKTEYETTLLLWNKISKKWTDTNYQAMESILLNKGVDVVWQREKVEVEDKKLDIKKVMAEAEMFDASNREHGHYYKDVSGLNIIDPYMVLKLFDVKDPCLQHIVKKALVAGGRGHKNFERDLKDIHDTSKRALEINNIKN